jgi:FkbM family methyltransferase
MSGLIKDISKSVLESLSNYPDMKFACYKLICEKKIFPKSIEDYIYINTYNILYKDLLKVAIENDYFRICFKNRCEFKSYYRLGLGVLPGYFKYYSLKEGDVVIDGGAYLGDFTLYAAKAAGKSGKVIAFEPDPLNYKKLLKNISLNNLENVIALNKGLYSDNTVLKFYNDSSGGSFFISDDIESESNGIVEVPVVKLDDEMDRLGISKIDFIKMDIEGAEIEALKGCKKILNSNNLNLAIASYHILDGLPTCKRLEKHLQEMGYNFETTNTQHLTTYGWKNKIDRFLQ